MDDGTADDRWTRPSLAHSGDDERSVVASTLPGMEANYPR